MLRAGSLRNRGSTAGRRKGFYHLHGVQIHAASSPMGTRGYFSGVKQSEREADHSFQLVSRIRGVPGRYRGPKIEVFRSFPRSRSENAGIVTQIKPRPLPSKSSSIHHSLIILPFDAI
jgi:hypothetical protein